MTDYDKMIDIDGFQVEEILRECLNIEGTPEEITISYNDFVNYSKFLMSTTMESTIDNMIENSKTPNINTDEKID